MLLHDLDCTVFAYRSTCVAEPLRCIGLQSHQVCSKANAFIGMELLDPKPAVFIIIVKICPVSEVVNSRR